MEENDEIFCFREREDEIEEILNDAVQRTGKFADVYVLEWSIDDE